MLFLFLSQAFAQAPVPFTFGSTPPSARWVVAETPSKRFPGEAIPGPTFTANEQVDVILVDGGAARVRDGDKYGWVPVASLTDQAPAGATQTITIPGNGGATTSLLGGVPQPPK